MHKRRYGSLHRLAVVALLGFGIGAAHAQPLGEGWLRGVETDAERFRLLERDLAGFSRAMWEVGYRYERLHQAILDGNYELAVHDWGGIEGAISRGVTRRPGRGANAEAFLLDGAHGEIEAEFESADRARAEAAFMRARDACMGCHQAEDVAYLNDQRLFRDLVFEGR